jgi:hypothetical protein
MHNPVNNYLIYQSQQTLKDADHELDNMALYSLDLIEAKWNARNKLIKLFNLID